MAKKIRTSKKRARAKKTMKGFAVLFWPVNFAKSSFNKVASYFK